MSVRNKNTLRDILVLNASAQEYMTMENFDIAGYQQMMETNLRSAFLILKDVLPVMAKRKYGRIISIGSVNQSKPASRLAIYSASKAALHNVILNCAREYAIHGITANTISPGVILTDRNTEILKDSAWNGKLRERIPAGRFGSIEDCVGIALLLASEAGSYITGADIPVTGGMHL